MRETSPVTVKSYIEDIPPEILLRDVAFGCYLRTLGNKADTELQPRFLLKENDLTTRQGFRLNFGREMHANDIEHRWQLERFEDQYFQPLLGDIDRARIHPTKTQIREMQIKLQSLAVSVADSLIGTDNIRGTLFYQHSRPLVKFIEKVIERRLRGMGQELARNLAIET